MGTEAPQRKGQPGRQTNSAPEAQQGGMLPPFGIAMGPAGMPEFIFFVGATAEEPLHDPRGSPGQYSAVLTLSRPGIRPLPEYELQASHALSGDSHVAITKPAYTPPGNPGATEVRARSAEGQVLFSAHPNARGFLATCRIHPFGADNFRDAYIKACALVAPSLSIWSAHLDVPLHVFQVEVLELATGNTMIAYVNPFPELPLAVPPRVELDHDIRALVSTYREALNSNSLPYQFLCFYKIAEALTRRRARLAKAAQRGGPPYARPVEVVPAEPDDLAQWLGAIFPAAAPTQEPSRTMYYESFLPPESRGKSFGELLGLKKGAKRGVLTEVRDLIAHALASAERGQPFGLVDFDDPLFHGRVHRWLPFMKVVARRMLKTDFPGAFLAHLPDPDPGSTLRP